MLKLRISVKFIILLVVCMSIIGTTALVGQSQQEETSSKTEVVGLEFWTEFSSEPAKPAMDALVQEFNETHPNIQVQHRAIDNEQYFSAMRTAFAGGEPPDIFQHEGNDNLFQFVRPDKVLDISSWIEENEERFQPGSLQSVKYEGKYWGAPYLIHIGTVIHVNNDLLKKYDIELPETWSEFIDACEVLQNNGVQPIAIGNKYGWMGAHVLFPLQVRWVGTERMRQVAARVPGVKYTDPDFVQAAQFYQDLNDEEYFSDGKVSDDYAAALGLFYGGRAGFFMTATWLVRDLPGYGTIPFDWKVIKFPYIEGQNGSVNSYVGGARDGISIAKDTEYPEEALEFLDFMTQKKAAEQFSVASTMISAIVGATNKETADPILLQIVEEQISVADDSVPFLEQIIPAEVAEDPIWMGSVGVMTGELNALEWMELVEAEAQKHDPVIQLD